MSNYRVFIRDAPIQFVYLIFIHIDTEHRTVPLCTDLILNLFIFYFITVAKKHIAPIC